MPSSNTITIFHNPRCSKSRAALALLQDRGAVLDIVEYLKTPPSRTELEAIMRKLGMKPEAVVRKGEAEFKEHYAGRTLSDAEWLDALAAHPILMERPIATRGERAVLGRPPEKVLTLL
jgi:arsenate reductase